ncbi:N-acetylglucosamine kinase [Vibrio viridaestus]|uniref:N-acetylglucosamine kinase n=1 Tax=Vibrio viridaestus TaxID=2487322 RepID=A0A3N9TH27_9VIBR|nr:N-acetylglucosamine kinase [Vibrio viridaestus]RQW63591.1 N-acetylglucosamine kinase [Vibrio viridaestus]
MYFGFDVGGTKIEFGAFDNNLERVASERVPTPKENYDDLVNAIVSLVTKYDLQFGVKGSVGIGFPGTESSIDRKVLTVNIPCANGKTLGKDLSSQLKRDVILENDANCFALSEAWDDELKGFPSVLGLILGTGFGGGMTYRGKVFSGLNGCAGELGHIRVPIDAWLKLGEKAPMFQCGCGNKGCLDNYLSGRGFEQLYENHNGQKKSAKDIINGYYNNEKVSCEFVEFFLDFLACCLGNLFTGLDPHAVVLGGGLSNFDVLYDELPKRIPQYLLSVATCPKILKAKHGDSGGVRGAAFLNIGE